MAAPDLNTIIRCPGRLCINPSAFTAAWPHGGQGLGAVQDIVFKPGRSSTILREESYGNEVYDIVDLGESVVVAAALKSWDADAVAALFPSTTTGSVSRKRGIFYPYPTVQGGTAGGTFRPGTMRSNSAVRLLFTPNDTAKYPGIYLYNALPMVEEAAQIRLTLEEDGLIPVVFYGTRDQSHRVYSVARMEDLT